MIETEATLLLYLIYPIFLDPGRGPWRAGWALRASPARRTKGGGKKRGTFPIRVIRHLCQQFQVSNNVSLLPTKSGSEGHVHRFALRQGRESGKVSK